MHRDAGNLFHRIPQTFDMLDVQSGVDINAAFQQFYHVLISFGVTGAGSISMCQFVN